MIFQPRNRNVKPDTLAFHVGPDRVAFYVDDIWSNGNPMSWGRPGSVVRVESYYNGRFTLADDRGRYFKHAACRKGEGRRRVKTFATAPLAALFAIQNNIESCE